MEKAQEYHGIDMTEVVPQNFLTLSVSMKALDENVIRAKYPEEIAAKLLENNAELNLYYIIYSENVKYSLLKESNI